MSIRVLHMADAHLGASLTNFGTYAERRRAEQEAAFQRAIGVALAERVHVVLIAGDLFDTYRPDPHTVNLARRELTRLKEAGIKALAVPGTHDSLSYAGSVYRRESLPFHHLFIEPTFAEPVTLEIEGVKVSIYGIAYDREGSKGGWSTLERRHPDGIHIALAHAACRFSPQWPIAPDDLPFLEEDLGKLGMNYVALGHYHNRRLFHAGGRVVGAYSGSLEARDWTEPGERHVLLVEWEAAGAPPAVQAIAVQTRKVDSAAVDVSGLSEPDDLVRVVAAACPPESLWRVTLTGEPEVVPDPEAIASVLEATHGHVLVSDETTLVTSHRIRERCEEETVRGEFFRRLIGQRANAVDDRGRAVADRAIKLGLRVFG